MEKEQGWIKEKLIKIMEGVRLRTHSIRKERNCGRDSIVS